MSTYVLQPTNVHIDATTGQQVAANGTRSHIKLIGFHDGTDPLHSPVVLTFPQFQAAPSLAIGLFPVFQDGYGDKSTQSAPVSDVRQPTPPHIMHVPNPRAPITELAKGYEARCHHCEWTMAGTIRAYLDEQAKYHRHQHRTAPVHANSHS